MKLLVLATVSALAALIVTVVTVVVTITAWIITIGWLKLIVLFVLIQ